MSVRLVEIDDLDFVVGVLAERRAALVPHAPQFWKPAARSNRYHHAFLKKLLTRDGAVGYRTDTAVLIAARVGQGWSVDDAVVPEERWAEDPDAEELWTAFARDHTGDAVRMVCPVYEPARGEFAASVGLRIANTWWLLELPGSGGGTANETVELRGATAVTIAAPPVYAPPGPMLFLREVADPRQAVPDAAAVAPRLGCAGIIIDQRPADAVLQAELESAGFRPHCAYYTGTL